MGFDLEQAITVLERTPTSLRAMLAGLAPAWVRGDEGPGTWSPCAVIGHLIHGEKTDWIPRARIILEQGQGRPFDPFDREAMLREPQDRSLEALLDEFTRRRGESLATLRDWKLTPADLARRGTHPALGPVTLAQLLAAWVVHDLDHVTQVARVMAKQYTEAVGPWRAYLSVLDDRRKP